jgi:hypothetical protein
MHQWMPPTATVKDTAHPQASPWLPHPITTDIPSLPKDIAVAEHTLLLQYLYYTDTPIIAYTDGSQLQDNTSTSYYIPYGLLQEVRVVIPMGGTLEVFDAELWAIDECLKICQKYICLY